MLTVYVKTNQAQLALSQLLALPFTQVFLFFSRFLCVHIFVRGKKSCLYTTRNNNSTSVCASVLCSCLTLFRFFLTKFGLCEGDRFFYEEKKSFVHFCYTKLVKMWSEIFDVILWFVKKQDSTVWLVTTNWVRISKIFLHFC